MEKQILKWIDASPTAYHAVKEAKTHLLQTGFTELTFENHWKLEKGKGYFIVLHDASIIAFQVGTRLQNPSIQIVASHNDSPMLKIKPNGSIVQNGYTKLNTEIYGGAIYSSWLDRVLGIAGRVVTEENHHLKSEVVTLDETVIIPNVAIHLNRDINNNSSLNAQTDMLALLSLEPYSVSSMLEAKLGKVNVLDYDLFLYNKEEAKIVGAKNELICGPRLDNLECFYTSLQAFLHTSCEDNINMWVGFNHEEVGSRSNHGADSTFLPDVIESILSSLSLLEDKQAIFHRSMIISADNAHAIHPNHPEKSDPTNFVKMNEGIVIKYNSGLSYTTDAISGAIFKAICNEGNIPYQVYTNRSDLRGGGTLGSILLSHLRFICVDIGLAQLAMHSSYETAGVHDLSYMEKALKIYYSKHLTWNKLGEIELK